MCACLDSKKGDSNLYSFATQRDTDGKDVHQARAIKGRNILTDARSVTGRWKEYFDELMNEGNEREPREEEVNVVVVVDQ